MKLLITGGAGFIGSHFIRYILQKYSGYSVINYDLLTYAANKKSITELEKYQNYRFIKGDIGNKEFLNKVVYENKIQCIINFAAETHVDRSINNPALFIETNVQGTNTLLEVAAMHNVHKFIQISTDEVYGTTGGSGSFCEESPLLPNNPYSASKAGADMLVRSYNKTYGLPVNIVRSSNNYGSYQNPEKFIPLMITQAVKGKSLPIYGDGLQVRDWLHVEDNCSAIDLILHKGEDGEIYNVGGGSERSNLQVVRFILDDLNQPESLIYYVEDRPGHDRRYAIDCSKIKKYLGWEQKYEDFEKGLQSVIKWYVNDGI